MNRYMKWSRNADARAVIAGMPEDAYKKELLKGKRLIDPFTGKVEELGDSGSEDNNKDENRSDNDSYDEIERDSY